MVNQQAEKKKADPKEDEAKAAAAKAKAAEEAKKLADEAARYGWPAKEKTSLLGKKVTRLDGMPKSTGMAKYTYDVNLKNQLIAKGLGCPHAHCKIKSIDIAPARAVPGVVEVMLMNRGNRALQEGDEIEFQGDLLAVVAAETEGAAREGLAAINVQYEMLPVYVKDADLAGAKAAMR